MMHRADHAAQGIEDNIEINDAQRRRFPNYAQQHKHVGDHDGREELQKIFHPEVHHPEAPKIIDDKTGARAGEETHRIESWNRQRGVKKHPRHIAEVLLSQHAAQAPEQDDNPEEKSDHEKKLPQATEIEIFPALVAQPEPEASKPAFY